MQHDCVEEADVVEALLGGVVATVDDRFLAGTDGDGTFLRNQFRHSQRLLKAFLRRFGHLRNIPILLGLFCTKKPGRVG